MKLINDKQWRNLRARILALIGDRPRSQRQFAALVIDGFLCLAAVWIAFSLRVRAWEFISRPIATFAACALVLWYPIAWQAGVYRSLIRYSGQRFKMHPEGTRAR